MQLHALPLARTRLNSAVLTFLYQWTEPLNPSPEPAGIRLKVEGPLAWILIGNPDRMNAMTTGMWRQLPDAIQQAESNPEVRVIILRGAGTRAFSAGADISEFETARTAQNAAQYDALNDAAFRAITGAVKPTLAMIHGFCFGGGLAIAACCDLRLSDDAAQFSIPAAKLGVGYNQRWVRPLLAIMRAPQVKELLFTGQRIDAKRALQMGLVNRVLGTEELDLSARALAGDIAANAPLSVGAAKLAVDELLRCPEHPDVERLDAAVNACFASEDYIEGRRAFMEKRKPQFKGR